MENYEGLFIVKPDLRDEEVKNVCKSIGDAIAKNGGSVQKEEEWGKRPLAYKVKKSGDGYYYKVDFSAPPAAIMKLETAYKLHPGILRTMITKRG
ncbi:MAG: 30S ribosomal protein S6 [Candidatus Omnitrophica bacterium]|nr:30S ribosomal protein S6 [Candidatus Omnitrophota bacterium]